MFSPHGARASSRHAAAALVLAEFQPERQRRGGDDRQHDSGQLDELRGPFGAAQRDAGANK